MKKIGILGSTGSIGTQTLEIVRNNKDLQVTVLAAGSSVSKMEDQIREFCPQMAVMWSEEAAGELRTRVADTSTRVLSGMEGLLELAVCPEMDELVKRVCKELLENKQELVIRKGQELIRVLIKDIIYIEAEKNYLVLRIGGDMIRIRETMTNALNELQGKGFIRCHKGYLVNADYIEKLRSSEVLLRVGNESIALPMGRSYEKEVRKRILEMLRD